MNILVINGSPKGRDSVTLQTALWLEKVFPQHTFDWLHAGAQIRSLTRDFAPAAEKLRAAELILFAYPVYTFLAPSQLHEFIALMQASGVALAGKAATQLTTSKHFYDITAHSYVQECMEDLGCRFIRGLSADMSDLLTQRGRNQARNFMERVERAMALDLYETPRMRLPEKPVRLASPAEPVARDLEATVAIVADLEEDSGPLAAMVARFQAVLPCRTRLIRLSELPMQGGCLGCFHCAAQGKCVYTDGFDDTLREKIQSCDAVVFAGRVQQHSFGAAFKRFDDRQFCNGHRTVTMGKPTAWLVDGDLDDEPNLRLLIESRAQVGGNWLAGAVDDRHDVDAEVDRAARALADALRHPVDAPRNFFGVGGTMIFRDLIWQMRGLMKEDHRFYRRHGFYRDMPHRKLGTLLGMELVGLLMKLPGSRGRMTKGMLMPYKKVLERAEREAEPPRR